ncbi:MAG TPA: DegT/DnrJ/EryC1/StrS family aminotransferase, partial [Candidatus Eremiobacteraeota bacterium]|nr:DegT/DnrJ/EryC1/StrS family aminotransferase [Candidatus Eremiobacteraeota bacterium]
EKIEEKISSKTRAIIGVHLYGQPFDMDRVKSIAQKYNLYLIEDCAQSHGACYKGIRVGVFGEMGCFSFYPGKNLGAYGEAGAVITNNESYINRIKSLRNHGSIVRYYHDEVGFNMRMDGFQGAVLDIKLKYLDNWNNRRKQIARIYQKGITNTSIKMQYQPEWSESVYHLFVITVSKRDKLIEHLQKNNIFPGLHYPVPCHLQKAYSHLGYRTGDMPEAEYLSEHCLSLPMYPELTDDEVYRVIDLLNKWR